MVKWISQLSSEQLFWVRVLVGAHKYKTMNKIEKENIPNFVSHVTKMLQNSGFEAYLVGGCVRDMLMNKNPKDWDITTNATPQQIQEVFSDYKTIYENKFGTVSVLNIPPESVSGETRISPDQDNQVQITTYRSEIGYSDNRRPDSVSYETELEKDLERRDFTINALAFDPFNGAKGQIIDIFNGLSDIKDKTIKCVLDADTRFKEDSLRMIRAIRFSTTLNFTVSYETLKAIEDNKELIKNLSNERVRDEFIKIINSPSPAFGITLMEKTGILPFILPEIIESIGCEQKGAHIYDVYNHLLHALQHAANKEYSLEIRLAALFHDIGKPATRRYDPKKDKYTFFGHEVIGARIAKKILERLNFSRVTIDLVVKLIRNHMFFSDTEQITLSAVRRIIQNVGKEHIWDLMKVRECDRVGMKKAEAPYRLRKYFAMIEQALRDPISVGQLKIDGTFLMKELHMKPGPRIGWILHALLEEVLENPDLNTQEYLKSRSEELNILEDQNLKDLGEKAQKAKEKAENQEISELHMKHGISEKKSK